MKKSEGNEEISYVGHILSVQEYTIARRLSSYDRYVETITPLAIEFNKIGLQPLTNERLLSIQIGNTNKFLDEYQKLSEADIANVGFIFRPMGNDAIAKGRSAIASFLGRFQLMLRNNQDTADCPIVDGVPVVTEEFKNAIREAFTNRILTKEGSDFYKAFLVAKDAVKALFDMGGFADNNFYFDKNEGLGLVTVPEERPFNVHQFKFT
jgi:hypothetical protein